MCTQIGNAIFSEQQNPFIAPQHRPGAEGDAVLHLWPERRGVQPPDGGLRQARRVAAQHVALPLSAPLLEEEGGD